MNNNLYRVHEFGRLGTVFPHAVLARRQVADAQVRAICKDAREAHVFATAHAMLTFLQGLEARMWHGGTLTLDSHERLEIEELIANATGAVPV